jgi:oxalate decarboxylase/phosphoglucose isomerase-like protein (cupin superfamily)
MTGGDFAVVPLSDSSDVRGVSFSLTLTELSMVDAIQDIHIAAIEPGETRGNHYHVRRGELITVIFQDRWSLHWDTGLGTAPKHRVFEGRGAVAFSPPLNWSHAVRNDGDSPLWIFVASDRPYDRADDDAVRRDAIARIVTD